MNSLISDNNVICQIINAGFQIRILLYQIVNARFEIRIYYIKSRMHDLKGGFIMSNHKLMI